MPSLAYQILTRRRRLGLTQEQLAAAVGIARPRIAELESGANPNPKIQIVRRISEALGCELRMVRRRR